MIIKCKSYKIKVCYHDEHCVIVDKPSGLLSIQDRYQENLENVKQALINHFGEIYTVHRLDKETSGLILFAKTTNAHKHFNEQFQQHLVKKIYWAFVSGVPPIEEGKIEVPIFNDMQNSGKMLIHKEGKEALTFFKLRENFGTISLIEFFPQTGRTHQIRVHAKYIGCPLLVDSLYHQKNEFYLSEVKRNYRYGKFKEERPLVKRLTLHAKSLKLINYDGNELFVESELPKDLNALYKQLKKTS